MLPTTVLNTGGWPDCSNNLSAPNPKPKTVAPAPPATQAPLTQAAKSQRC